jgi:uncharacterized cupredoxin-like copper-binding protein
VRRPRVTLLPAAALLIAGCASGAVSSTLPTTAVTPSAPAASVATTRIEVQLTDALKIAPAEISVPAGARVTFVVTNAGATDHEFFLGDEAAQAEHEDEMQDMGGMTHDEPMGIGVKPGETKELTVTFPEAGSTLAGCHTAGHYAAGMKATVQIGA